MILDFVFSNELFGENKPNFHLLKNPNAKIKLKNNFRLKNSTIEGRYLNSSNFTFLISDDSDFNINRTDEFDEKTVCIVKNDSNYVKKSIKFFNIELIEKNLKNITLKKEIFLTNAISCIESSEDLNQNTKLKKNYTAIGTKYGGINIWNTNKIMEEEPFCVLNESNISEMENFFPIREVRSRKESNLKKIFPSSLKWNPESPHYLLEGASNGSLNYWNTSMGKRVFEIPGNGLPVFSLNWRNFKGNEILYKNGKFLACFFDIRNPRLIFTDVFKNEIKGIQWLNCENLFTVIETSGLICLKDIRFQRDILLSKNIFKNSIGKKIIYFQFSPKKKNVLIFDNQKNIYTFALNDFKIKKLFSEKLDNPFNQDFFWLNSENHESLVMVNNDCRFSVFNC
jgi:hypothetical protein